VDGALVGAGSLCPFTNYPSEGKILVFRQLSEVESGTRRFSVQFSQSPFTAGEHGDVI